MPHEVTIHLDGGVDGVLRVVSLLRGRRYRISDLAVNVYDGVAVSDVRVTVVATLSQTELLLERLRQLIPVVGAEHS